MSKQEMFHRNDNPWEEIYESPEKYNYYDLVRPHESLDQVIETLRAKKANRVLDLGCGLGRNTIALVQEGFNVIGIDPAGTAINQLQSQLDQLQLNAKLIKGRFQSIPLEDALVDAVISVQTIQHGTLHNVKKGISEIERVLKPNGCVFVTVPGRYSQGKLRPFLVKTARKIADRTYVPTQGKETGLPHFVYNKSILLNHFNNFKIIKIWKDDKDYYCFLGEKI